MKYITKVFEDIDTMSQYLACPVTPMWRDNEAQGRLASTWEGTKDGFYHTESWEQAQSRMVYGDTDSLRLLQKTALNQSRKRDMMPHKRLSTSVAGFAPHIPNYLKGLPNAMFCYKPSKKLAPVLTVAYFINAHCRYGEEELAKAGVKLLNAIHALEESGTRVTLYIGLGSSADEETIVGMVKVKDAEQKAYWGKMAYFLCNADFLRRHMLRLMEVCPDLHDRGFIHSYGTPVMNEDIFAKALTEAHVSCKMFTFTTLQGMPQEQVNGLLMK